MFCQCPNTTRPPGNLDACWFPSPSSADHGFLSVRRKPKPTYWVPSQRETLIVVLSPSRLDHRPYRRSSLQRSQVQSRPLPVWFSSPTCCASLVCAVQTRRNCVLPFSSSQSSQSPVVLELRVSLRPRLQCHPFPTRSYLHRRHTPVAIAKRTSISSPHLFWRNLISTNRGISPSFSSRIVPKR